MLGYTKDGGTGTTPPPVTTDPPPVTNPPAGAITIPAITAAYPLSAVLASSGNVQATLDSRKIVRLNNSAYNEDITLKSDYQLYGLPGTDWSRRTITIQPGATGFVLCGIKGAIINAHAGSVIQGNVFKRISNSVIKVFPGAIFDSNLMLHLNYTEFNVDTSTGGRWSNNRLIFVKQQSNKTPMNTLIGDPGRQSMNNVMVARTFQGAYGGGIRMSNQGDLAVVGYEYEDFNKWLFSSTSSGALRTFLAHGGNRLSGAGYAGGFDELWVISDLMGGASPGIQSSGIKRVLTANINLSTTGHIDSKFAFGAPTSLSAADQATLKSMLLPGRAGQPWERASFPNAIPDPLGVGWNNLPAHYADSTAMIQAGVNANGIFLLAAGTYYVDGTITLLNRQGVIGAGENKTAIVATKNQDIFRPVFTAPNKDGAAQTGAIYLTDMTLYGGTNQLHFNHLGDQPSDCVISHVTFRNASAAGMCIDNIYGMDNNFFDALNYVNCATGFKQIPNPNYSGDGEPKNMAYIDKTMHYGCRFVGCGVAVDMRAKRADNLDTFVNCRFQGNGKVGIWTANNALMFAQTDFLDNTKGMTSIDTWLVGCYFAGVSDGFISACKTITAEGCTFVKGNGAASAIVTNPDSGGARAFIMNCTSDMKLGINTGEFLNSRLADVGFDQLGITLVNGVKSVFLSGAAVPQGQLLFGAVFSQVP